MPHALTMADYWTAAAATFDTEPDHSLTHPAVRAAWSARLREWIPSRGVDVLEVGCGTGSLSLLLAELGHQVTGLDLSPGMVSHAQRKLAAAGYQVAVFVADAATPPVDDHRFDVVVARHVLWTLPDPLGVLRRWIGLLRPGGHLVLIEGRWATADTATSVNGEADMPWWGVVCRRACWPRLSRLWRRGRTSST